MVWLLSFITFSLISFYCLTFAFVPIQIEHITLIVSFPSYLIYQFLSTVDLNAILTSCNNLVGNQLIGQPVLQKISIPVAWALPSKIWLSSINVWKPRKIIAIDIVNGYCLAFFSHHFNARLHLIIWIIF